MIRIVKMKRLIVLLVLFVAYEYGNTTNAITLKDALQNAYLYSETVGIKEHMKDFGTINLEEAIVGFVPTLTLSWDYNKVFKRDTGTMANNGSGNANQNANPLTAGLGNLRSMETKSVNLHSSLALWKTLPGLYVAIKGKQAKDYEYNDFLESFGLLFIQKYMDVIYNTKALEVYQQMSDLLKKKVEKVSVMSRYGVAKRDKVVLAEAQYYQNKADEIKTKSDLDKVRMDYKIMTGIEPVDLEIPNVLDIPLPAKNRNDFIALVLAKNSKLLQTEMEAVSQKYYMWIKSFDLLPELHTDTTYMQYNLPGFMKYTYGYMGIGASWTINGSANRYTNARREYKNYRIADLNHSLTLKQTEQDAGYAWDQYFAMMELVKATEKALKASKDSLKEVKVSVSTGTATFIDEMDVESQYLNANLNYLNAQKALILSYYKMVSMTGVGKLPVV